MTNIRTFINFFRQLVVCVVILPAVAAAAILPETIGAWQRGDPQPAPAADAKVWAEYGLQDSEQAAYADGAKTFNISAWRFTDATGAMAAFDQIRPADSKAAKLMGLAVESGSNTTLAAGNYLFVFNGYQLKPEELSHVVATVPHYAHSPLPALLKYMPAG